MTSHFVKFHKDLISSS